MNRVHKNNNGDLCYYGDTFEIILARYSDPDRLNLARNAAIYLGKPDRDNIQRPLSIISQGHVGEIFRGEQAEFEFVGVSKEAYDHIITYTTRNMRAAGSNRALVSEGFTMPSDRMKNETLVEVSIEASMSNYQHLMDKGETRQVARAAMPIAAKMNPFVYQFNFLTLGESLFKQRLWEKGAQGNTVKVVRGMFELCSHMDKELWETFYEYKGTPVIEWENVRKKIKKNKITLDDFMKKQASHEGNYKGSTPLDVVLSKMFGEQKTMW